MASTVFIDGQSVIYASWLNDVNNGIYNGVFAATTITPTNIVCNGTVSGSGFTGLVNDVFASPDPIGSTTPNSGAFTTLSATSLTAESISGLVTPLSAAQGGTGFSAYVPGIRGQVFTSNGTFTIPSGITSVKATVIGGGGGGGSNSSANASGGGSGGTSVVYLTNLTPNATIAVTVGAAGTVSANSTGGTGGTSSIASGTQTITTVTCTGGAGGGTTNTGGAGGTATGGTLNIDGVGGGNSSPVGYFTGSGAGATFGGSGGAGSGGGGYTARPGTIGGGGGGGWNTTGGVGGAGIVIFEW